MKTILQFLNQLLKKKCFHLFVTFFMLTPLFASTAIYSLKEIKISLDIKNASITEVFDAIEQRSSLTFVFDEQITQTSQPISIKTQDESVDNVLKIISDKTGFKFKKINNTISVIKPNQVQKTIKGNVVDEQGMPLPGVSIMEKGTKNTGITDIDGNFSLSINPKWTLKN